MANELRHKTVGTELTQTEFEDEALHQLDSQATGDIIYASSATQLTRLAKGAESHFLKQGASIPEWATNPAGATIVRKTADQTVNDSATLVNDTHLLLAVGANDVWIIEVILKYTSPSVTPDLDHLWAVPSGGEARGIYDFKINGVMDAGADMTSERKMDTGSGIVYYGMYRILYVGGGTAGNLQLQWAQSTATSENTVMQENSCIIAYQLA